MTAPMPSAPKLRTTVVMDYQNVHLTAAKLFSRHLPLHESLICPERFARTLIAERNARQKPGMQHARLSNVIVFRGLPSADDDAKPYAYNLAQKSQWEKSSVVQVVHRPLRYEYERDGVNRFVRDVHNRKIVVSKREKGIDVLCALAVLSSARKPDIDLVILASQDTDLEPAVEEATVTGEAKIETASWFDPTDGRSSREIRPNPRVWNTRLSKTNFDKCVDPFQY